MSVTLDHVTRTVDGVATIRDVSLTLERGTLSVLLGPTLSGKTSIMRLLAGLDRPTSGRVLVDGKDVTGLDVRQRSVAMVYQQFINYPSLTVYENIASPLRVQGRPREEIDRRVQEAARLLKLEPFLSRTPLQLSGGQQQRTAIARALVKGADLVLLDEPLGQPRLQAARGTARRAAAHLRGFGGDLRLCHHRAIGGAAARRQYAVHVGRRGAPASARRQTSIAIPTPCASRRCSPIRRSTSSVSRRRTAPCSMPAASTAPATGLYAGLADGAYRVGFRAHQLEVANGVAGRHAFSATVTVTEITGSESFVHLHRRLPELGCGAARRA